MVTPSPSPSPRADLPPPLLIPADNEELDKEFDSFPDISTRHASLSLAARHTHQHKPSLHLAPSAAPVTYQLSALPLASPPAQSERQTFLANAALRSTFIRQGTLQRLSTLRGSTPSAVLAAYRPPAPIVVRQESRSRLGTLTRQPTIRFAVPAPPASSTDVNVSSAQQKQVASAKPRLASHVPIVQVADSFLYRSETEDDERCQHGFEVMPMLATLLEHQSQQNTLLRLPLLSAVHPTHAWHVLAVLCGCSHGCWCDGRACLFARRRESAAAAAARRRQAAALLHQGSVCGELRSDQHSQAAPAGLLLTWLHRPACIVFHRTISSCWTHTRSQPSNTNCQRHVRPHIDNPTQSHVCRVTNHKTDVLLLCYDCTDPDWPHSLQRHLSSSRTPTMTTMASSSTPKHTTPSRPTVTMTTSNRPSAARNTHRSRLQSAVPCCDHSMQLLNRPLLLCRCCQPYLCSGPPAAYARLSTW